MNEVCPICGREHGGEMQWHHLKPVTFRSRSKEVHDQGNKILIHRVCHQKIHATFSEVELYSHFHTIDRLVEHDEMKKFAKWVARKPVEFYDKNDDTKSRKKRRRR